MRKYSKNGVVAFVAVIMIFSLVAVPAMAGMETPPEGDYTAGSMIFDTVFLRPFGILATAFGSVVFVASLPFSLPGGNTAKVGQKLVVDPFKYTFQRPLGKINQ